ncbi:hypothetical protein [Pseudooctadecabacter jejudonensis]|nr:hypothetical protein [Pseudooctadecabacter jejudonensis]
MGEIAVYPSLEERFWGYEIKMTQSEMTSALIVRGLASFGAAVFGLTTAVMFVSALIGLGAAAPEIRIFTLMILAALTLICATVADRTRRVRVQIDTRNGEVRQVTRGRFGPETILTRHSMDTVSSVEIVASDFDRSFGQIHMRIKGYGPIVAADGCVTTLTSLRDRIAADCGVRQGRVLDPVWSGPLSKD